MSSIAVGQHIRAPQMNITLDRYLATDITTTLATGASELVMQWQTAQNVSANIIPSSDARTFTVTKTGIWCVGFIVRVRFNTAPTTGDMFSYVYVRDTGINGEFAGRTEQAPLVNAPLLQARCTLKLTAGSQIEVRVRNTTDQILTLANIGDLCHLFMCWLQPA